MQLLAFLDDARVNLPTVHIELWRADAVVLFDWLNETDFDAIPITHPAQKQALLDLLARFEQDTDLPWTAGAAEIASAQEDVAKDMGW